MCSNRAKVGCGSTSQVLQSAPSNQRSALNIRERRQYDTRHTCATLCLMPGMNPAFIANQLGHCVVMLLSTYAKWIGSSSDWRELEKLPPRVELAQNWPKTDERA